MSSMYPVLNVYYCSRQSSVPSPPYWFWFHDKFQLERGKQLLLCTVYKSLNSMDFHTIDAPCIDCLFVDRAVLQLLHIVFGFMPSFCQREIVSRQAASAVLCLQISQFLGCVLTAPCIDYYYDFKLVKQRFDITKKKTSFQKHVRLLQTVVIPKNVHLIWM